MSRSRGCLDVLPGAIVKKCPACTCGSCDICLAPAITEGEKALTLLRKNKQARARAALRSLGLPLLRLVKKSS